MIAAMMRLLPVIVIALGGCGADVPALVVVDEHPLAWPVWEEARARGDLRPGAVLLHLDAHEDLGVFTGSFSMRCGVRRSANNPPESFARGSISSSARRSTE